MHTEVSNEKRKAKSFPDDPLPSLDEVLAGYVPRATELAFSPGTASSYSNRNFLLLAMMAERVSGMPFVEYATGNIPGPLGMTETAYSAAVLPVPDARSTLSVDATDAFLRVMESNGKDGRAMISDETDRDVYLEPVDILPAWGGLSGSARDLLRLAAVFLDGGQLEGILRSSTVVLPLQRLDGSVVSRERQAMPVGEAILCRSSCAAARDERYR